MAGHSKWANIKHRKARQDASRGKIWTKVIREITVAAKGGPDPDDNPRLRLALDKANASNMPKDTIKRAIQKGSGTGEMGIIEELVFEGYGPNGVAILVETMTDNRNRTVADVRHAFSKFGGNMGTDGSVAYLFSKLGVIHVANSYEEDLIMELALEAGAEDLLPPYGIHGRNPGAHRTADIGKETGRLVEDSHQGDVAQESAWSKSPGQLQNL